MSYYSQFGEDQFLVENKLVPERGFFIEVGAYDGVASSNTLYFEQHGWRGLCIEPDPEIASRCRDNRLAFTLNCAIGMGAEYQTFRVNNADRGTSGLAVKETGNSILVPVHHLSRIVEFCQPNHIDLLSVDTEGTEHDVLRSLGGYRPRVIIAEFWSMPSPPDEGSLRGWFEFNGYQVVHKTQVNLIAVLK